MITLEVIGYLYVFTQGDAFDILTIFSCVVAMIQGLDALFYTLAKENMEKIHHDEDRDYFKLPIKRPIELTL